MGKIRLFKKMIKEIIGVGKMEFNLNGCELEITDFEKSLKRTDYNNFINLKYINTVILRGFTRQEAQKCFPQFQIFEEELYSVTYRNSPIIIIKMSKKLNLKITKKNKTVNTTCKNVTTKGDNDADSTTHEIIVLNGVKYI